MSSKRSRTSRKWVREEECRSILEEIYCEPFPSCRPDFLVNPETGKCLELDCYNQRLGIACEYNGVQHYQYPNIFHSNEQQFKDQMRRDKFKEKVCMKNGILLLIVPYTVKNIRVYLEERLCRYTKLLIRKKILTRINVTNCTILKEYLGSRLKIRTADETRRIDEYKASTKSKDRADKSSDTNTSTKKPKTNTKPKSRSSKSKSSIKSTAVKSKSKSRSTAAKPRTGTGSRTNKRNSMGKKSSTSGKSSTKHKTSTKPKKSSTKTSTTRKTGTDRRNRTDRRKCTDRRK